MPTAPPRKGEKAKNRKMAKRQLRKSQSVSASKAILAGIASIIGPNSQGQVYYEPKRQVARVVFREGRDPDAAGEWLSKVSQVLGINEGRISISPSAPKDFGTGSSWLRIGPDGSVEIDPGLDATYAPDGGIDDPDDPEAKDMPLFVYGTFKDPKTLDSVIGHQADLIPDELEGYKHNELADGYSDIVPDKAASVQGFRVNVSDGDLHKTDGWEKRYQRREVTLKSGEKAWAYFLHTEPASSDPGKAPAKPDPGTPESVRVAARFEGEEYQVVWKEAAAEGVDEDGPFTFVLGPIMIPDKPDNQGDSISVTEIEKAAHAYVEDSQRSGVLHKVMLKKREVCLVESHVVRSHNYEVEGVKIPFGTWVAGFRVYDGEIRSAIKSGHFRGFSIGADAMAVPLSPV